MTHDRMRSAPTIRVVPYEPGAATSWDRLVASAPMATFLHTRLFLSYHGDRFHDVSVMIEGDDGELLGVLPAAVDPENEGRVASHPGATFGGMIHEGGLFGTKMLDALTLVAGYYRERGFTRLGYSAVPSIYHRRPSGDDLYGLFRLDAERARCDLSCTLDLETGARLSSRRRRGLNKARRANVEVVEGSALVDELWPVLELNLADRHGARPVHTAAEMQMLVNLFPEDITIVMGFLGGEATAGVVLFQSPVVVHAQYIASSPGATEVGALDAVFDHCIAQAKIRGARFFDFGTSNQAGGRVLNDGLYDFKTQFGGGGVAYERYELELRTATPKPVSP